MQAGPATAVFLLLISGVSLTYACWVRGSLVERTNKCIELRLADEQNKAAIASLTAELKRRDVIIANRDNEIAVNQKQTEKLMAEVERLSRENESVARWTCDSIPSDVLGLLKGGSCSPGAANANTSSGNADEGR